MKEILIALIALPFVIALKLLRIAFILPFSIICGAALTFYQFFILPFRRD